MIHRYNRNIKRREGNDAKVANFVEMIARASVGDSTQKGVRGKVADFVQRTSCIRNKNKILWLLKPGETDATVVALTEFGALRCFSVKNQSTIVRGYLAAIR